MIHFSIQGLLNIHVHYCIEGLSDCLILCVLFSNCIKSNSAVLAMKLTLCLLVRDVPVGLHPVQELRRVPAVPQVVQLGAGAVALVGRGGAQEVAGAALLHGNG